MKILTITFAYNELEYLKDYVNYYRSQGTDVYIIDNYSNDGTYEWLIENGIPHHRVNSNETFDLRVLQKDLERTLHILKPDWIVYAGIDLFNVFDKSVYDTIVEADSLGYNQLSVPCYSALNTGELFGTPLYKHFKRGGYWRRLTMISKYHPELKMVGDDIVIPDPNRMKVNGMMCNYGGCKPIAEQKEKLKRREKAWDNGLNKNTGRHFKKLEKINWLYEENKTIDFLQSEHSKYFKKLIK